MSKYFKLAMIDTKNFHIQKNNRLAVAELSFFDNESVELYLNNDKIDGKWYFFNRLNVPKEIRNLGIAKQLMEQVVEWADKENVNILNVVNPYGDLNMEKLERFYEKFGFIKIKTGLMIRKFKGSKK